MSVSQTGPNRTVIRSHLHVGSLAFSLPLLFKCPSVSQSEIRTGRVDTIFGKMGPRYPNLLNKEVWRNTCNDSNVIARFYMKESRCMVLLIRSRSGMEKWYEYFYTFPNVHFSGREITQFERVRNMLQRVHQKRVLGKKSRSSRWQGTCCTRSGFSGHEHGPRRKTCNEKRQERFGTHDEHGLRSPNLLGRNTLNEEMWPL